MKSVKSLSDLHSLALGMGAEVVAPGMRFNAARTVAALTPRAAVPPPAPITIAPVPEEHLSREAVERLLAENNARVMQELRSIIQQAKGGPAPASQGVPKEWEFHVEYDSSHAITNITAKAKP